jgi:hypothetical protein
MRKAFTISEQVAIADAIAERLGQRQGSRTDLKTWGNVSPSDEGRTRDIAAAKAGLGSGKTYEAAKKVVDTGAPALVAAHHDTLPSSSPRKWRSIRKSTAICMAYCSSPSSAD